ncbi:16S rRNA processing protein RimM [Devosia subaequoris]|uniref:Ribosome maturation factor RimM n=1 Tax=Devosia subaequoris TaxID=395930 RepID=A0A7W6IMP1_9HYPH|nr:ribosome maturation factor RimM [Devosia subaequoris]MBB4052430.1 16S rRNA processing protein RimM [Devosia subaequoris]MCP1209590.1 ribosome maturation factor RimM [Devosia subaequoris]
MADTSSRILMGTIGAAHGIKGEVRIASHTQDPEAIADYGPLETNRPGLVITIESARLQKTVLIARIEGVRDRNAAESLNGVELYVERDRLPEIEDEDDFYHADLIGLDARLDNGVSIGVVSAIYDHGAGDILEVRDERSGDSFLYPFTKAVVPLIRVADGYLVIAPPLDAEPGEEEPD